MAHRRATGAVEADVIAIRLAAAVAHPLRFACSCRRRRRWRYGRQLQQQQQQASGERVMRQPRQLLPERHYPDKYHLRQLAARARAAALTDTRRTATST